MSRFQWADLITTDRAAAGAFAEALGWSVSAPLDPTSGYRVFHTAAGPTAGLSGTDAAEAGSTAHWLLQLRVDDLAQTLRRARFLQLDVLVTPEEGDPHTAIVADPTGAVFAITDAPAPATSALDGAVLRCDRPDLGARVYQTLFGLRAGAPSAQPGGSVTPLRDGDATVAWLFAPDDPPEHGLWIPVFDAAERASVPIAGSAGLSLDTARVRRMRAGGAETMVRFAPPPPEP